MNSGWSFRGVREEDIPRLAELEQRCFSDQWSEASLRSGAQTPGNIRVLETAGKILGYTVTRRILDEAELLRIGVDPAQRGKGLGKALLEDFLQEEAAVSAVIDRLAGELPDGLPYRSASLTVYLDVRVGNAPAIALYERAGFETVARMKEYYRCPAEDGFRMVKTLDAQAIAGLAGPGQPE